jgi:hypothetical protein
MATTNKTLKPGVKIAPKQNTAVRTVTLSTADYAAIGNLITSKIALYRYQVNPKQSGKPGKVDKTTREYRLQPTSKDVDTQASLTSNLEKIIQNLDYKGYIPTEVVFNKLSPNSGTFPSFSFVLNNQKFDLVITSKVKGAGGLAFEDHLEADLNMYFSGQDEKNMLHSDTVKDLANYLHLLQDDSLIVEKTKIFQKRDATFSISSGFTFSNNTGKTIADIIIKNKSSDLYYLSLKLGKEFYIANIAVGNYFKDINIKKHINEYFGFDGMQMKGFGDEYEVQTDTPDYNKVRTNLQDILAQSYGSNLVIVNKKSANDNYIHTVKGSSLVGITRLDASCYYYPGIGRKYANIKTVALINGRKYTVHFQFRGTRASDIGPKYLRILLVAS